jgi:DNA-binding transcriptional LysR family regulator
MANLADFELFTHVARANSLTEAAKSLNITTSALSKKIKQLEQNLQVDLFSRASYRLTLTPSGEVLLEQCSRLLKELDDTRSLCNKFHDKPEGTLHVVAFSYFAKTLILPKLNKFLCMHPKLNVIIDSTERMPNFDTEQVDIVLGYSIPAPDQENIIQRSMGVTSYVLCAAPEYFAKFGTPDSLNSLCDHRYINHSSRPNRALKLKPKYNFSPKPSLELNNIELIVKAGLMGLGLIQIPLYIADEYLKSGQLVEVLSELQREGEHIYYYYPKYRHVQPKIRKFIDFFLS